MRRTSSLALILVLAATALPAAAQSLITNVPVQYGAYYLAANPATGMIYVLNKCGTSSSCTGPGTVSVINGASNTVVYTITVQNAPEYLVINQETNTIYVTNSKSNTVSVINGATNTIIRTINVGSNPTMLDVNPITNMIYVVNNGNGSGTTMSVINGNSNSVIQTVTVGNDPVWVAANSVTNTVYVLNYCGAQPGCTTHSAPSTVSVVNGANNVVTRTVTLTGNYAAQILRVNPATNQIWVLNSCGTSSSCLTQGNYSQVNGTVSEIDGTSFVILSATVGKGSAAMALNSVTNQAYTTATTDATVTVIYGGSTLTTRTVDVGNAPADLEVNTSTDTIFVCNSSSNTVSLVNPATLTVIMTINVGTTPVQAWVNPVINRIYVSNVGNNTVSVLSGVPLTAIQFVPVSPCRLVDTRPGSGGGGPIQANTSQNFNLPQLASSGGAYGTCTPFNLSTAQAYSLNVTVIPNTTLGYLTIWPTGEIQPYVSTMNSDGRIKANAAIIPAGYEGDVSVFVTDTTNILIDINGYFTTPGSTTLQFFTLPPCRLVDTRQVNNGQGFDGTQTFNLPQSASSGGAYGTCTPFSLSAAQAYSLNVTAVPVSGPVDYITVWPAPGSPPVVSTLNDYTGTVVANAAVVPAGTEQMTSAFTTNQTNLLIDINGYFAAPGSGGLSLYPQVPCRVLDTRQSGNGFSGTIVVNVQGSACQPPSTAGAYVFNATVVPPGPMLYLTLWPGPPPPPNVSTLNASDGAITSNMAIVPTSNGSIDAYAYAQTQLILDLFGYFAP